MSAIVSGDTARKGGGCLIVPPLPSEGDFEGHFMLTTTMQAEIKNEPPEDIDDVHNNSDQNQLYNYAESLGLGAVRPQITLTPTMKLLASPNPVDPKRKFPCPYENCTKSYGKSSHLRSHLTWHTGIKPYICQEPNCGKSFTRSDELNRHSRTHTGEKPFECMQCSKKFSRSDHLTKHVATHTKQMQTKKRTRPGEAAGSTPAKKEQNELTEMSPLPPEGMTYEDGMHFMATLLENAQYKDGRHVIQTEETTKTNEEPLNMPMPIKIKLERPGNSEEYKVVKTDEIASTKNDSSSNEKSTTFAATLHPKESPTQPIVINAANQPDDFVEDDHADNDDTNDDTIMPEANAPPLPQAGAPQAVQRFEDNDDFGHGEPERPYQCNECAKCFKRQDDLNRHMRTHTGEKPFVCKECKRRFNRSDHLKKHLKTHVKKER